MPSFTPVSYTHLDVYKRHIVQHIIFLLYNTVFISCTRYFLVLPSPISQLSTVYRIIQNTFYKRRSKCVQCIILSFFLFISVLVQPCSNRRDSHIGMNKFVIEMCIRDRGCILQGKLLAYRTVIYK